MVHQVIEILNIKTKIGKIDHGEIKIVKVGDITTEIMISRGSVDVAGEVTKTIGDNRIITEAEAMAGICNKDQQGQGYRSYGYGQNPQPQQQPYYDQQPRPAQWSTYVNYVTIRGILTIIVSLQAILWPELNKPLTRADNITTKMDKVNGLKGTMTTEIPRPSLFSSGGSRCC